MAFLNVEASGAGTDGGGLGGAREQVSVFQLGVSALSNPAAASKGWSGSKLYFGSFGEEGKRQPILWRVLQVPDETGSTGGILLQTDEIMTMSPFALGGGLTVIPGSGVEMKKAEGDLWSGSSIETYLNGGASGEAQDQGFLSGFSRAQVEAVLETQIAAGQDLKIGNDSYSSPAVNGKVFLLSAQEAVKEAYGYGSASSRVLKRAVSRKGQEEIWWLRSTVIVSADGASDGAPYVAVIDRDGNLTYQSLNASTVSGDVMPLFGQPVKMGVAPVLYLDASKILFLTGADWKKPGALSAVTEKTAAAASWKVTIQATDKSLSASLAGKRNGGAFERGSVVKISHTAARNVLTGANQVSALILDADGTVAYYGKINGDMSQSGSEFTISEEMKSGSYQLYVFAEKTDQGNGTDEATALGEAVSFQVSEKVTPVVTVLPTASDITYGQSLADSILSGGEVRVSVGNGAAEGKFQWKNGAMKPSVSDGGKTGYEVLFVPADQKAFNQVSFPLTLVVKKAPNPPTMPSAEISVGYDVDRVKGVSLPEGWSFQAGDMETELPAGGQVVVTAVYQDTQNYDNCMAVITIHRDGCTHKGGTATCVSSAVCEICHQPYGEKDPNHHGVTAVKGAKDATCTEAGYTGDIYCTDCGTVLTPGQSIAAPGHQFISEVTKEPTVDKEGEKTYTCSVCGYQYTETLERHIHRYEAKQVHWQGCLQYEEILYTCIECGDYYSETKPALGHDYQVTSRQEPTTEREGVIVYTCSRCGHTYTETIPKLPANASGTAAAPSKPSSGGSSKPSGGSSKPSGTSSGSSEGTVTGRMPNVEDFATLVGWDKIDRYILKSTDGSTVRIKMNGSLILPAKTLQAIQGKDIHLVLLMDEATAFHVYGKDVTGESLSDVNLKVSKDNSAIPAGLIEEAAKGRVSYPVSLAQDKDFGALLELELSLGKEYVGKIANLFHYQKDQEDGTLEYVGKGEIGEDGTALVPIARIGEYLLVIDDVAMDGSGVQTPLVTDPTQSSETTQTPEPEETETTPLSNAGQENSQARPVSPIAIVAFGLIVLGMALLLIVILRAQSLHSMESAKKKAQRREEIYNQI